MRINEVLKNKPFQGVITIGPDATVRDAYNDMIKEFELVDQQGTGRLFRRRGLDGSGNGVAPVTVPPIPVPSAASVVVPPVPTAAPTASAPPIVASSPSPVSVVSEGVGGPQETPAVTSATLA